MKEMKVMLYAAMERIPNEEVCDRNDVIRYVRAFDEQFLAYCEKELAKINTFFAEKLAEATRKFCNLKNELNANETSPKLSSPAHTITGMLCSCEACCHEFVCRQQ